MCTRVSTVTSPALTGFMGHGAMEKVASHGSGAGDRGKLILFGVDLSHLGKNTQLAFLALGAIGCAVAFSYLQEKSFRVKGESPCRERQCGAEVRGAEVMWRPQYGPYVGHVRLARM